MKKTCRRLFLLAFFACCVGFALEEAGLDVAAQKIERRLSTKALKDPPRFTAGVQVLINELDADQDGVDAAEFVELISTPNTSLDGFVLVFFNGGTTDTSYAAFDLDGVTTDANGFAIVGNVGVPGVDVTFAGNFLQQGPDAVALYVGDATSFPNGSPVSTTNLVDAVVYDTADPDDPELLTLLPEGPGRIQIDENTGGSPTTNSIQRCGSAARDGREFVVRPTSPNAANNGCPQKPNVDMNGDGRTDFVITRPGGSSALTEAMLAERRTTSGRRSRTVKQSQTPSLTAGDQTPWQWWSQNNGAPGGFVVDWGLLVTDNTVSGDFDGDGADDIAIWRPDPPSAFYSLDSSDFTFRYVAFGVPGDDPSVIGDYDGDGIDDPAVYRCPIGPPAATCYFFVAYSLNNPTGHITWEPWGFGTSSDWIPYPGDFNGDGKADFCVQNITNPNQAVFWLRHSQVPGHEVIHWGLPTDRVVPGDFDGDGRSDFTVVRVNEVDFRYTFWTLFRDGGIRVRDWGEDPDDITPGDYDGDGKTDLAIYRWWQPAPAFWILPSNGDPHRVFHWGSEGDFPLAKWQVQ